MPVTPSFVSFKSFLTSNAPFSPHLLVNVHTVGEIFPTAIRATNHGMAAAVGKIGAIAAAAWIVNLRPRDVFLVSALWSGVGLAVTGLFLPDTTGLDLQAMDAFHRCMMAGEGPYVGPATEAKHLSPVERWVLGWGRGHGAAPKPVAAVGISPSNS